MYFKRNYRDIGRLKFPRSVIITGCSSWTLYDSMNYIGYSVCILPGTAFMTGVCKPGFYPDLTHERYRHHVVKVESIKIGCNRTSFTILPPVDEFENSTLKKEEKKLITN